MLASGRTHPRWARWSILAEPTSWANGSNALDLLGGVRFARSSAALPGAPFEQGWIVLFSYDLGRQLEPAAQASGGAEDDRRWPDLSLARIEGALIYDHDHRRWWETGSARDLASKLNDADDHNDEGSFRTGLLRSSLSQRDHERAVARILDYIGAGDAYQVNLSRRLTAPFAGSTRELAASALRASRPWFGAYLELPDGRAAISLSPELFLQVDSAFGRILTRPIKGTLPADRDPRELLRSAKDAAELHMIVDLMRNDLGRVCKVGSMRVASPRTIETHPTVHHGVAEIEGQLREDASPEDILRATFPPGSVTGAPKIRAMQIIDELEPVRRGPYCGSIGFIDDHGNMTLNVAIRTMALSGRRAPGRFDLFDEAVLDYGTGGGIVADSNPQREWEETEQKAAVLWAALELNRRPRVENVGIPVR
jgi:para-aminobenzoate synthetase component 1